MLQFVVLTLLGVTGLASGQQGLKLPAQVCVCICRAQLVPPPASNCLPSSPLNQPMTSNQVNQCKTVEGLQQLAKSSGAKASCFWGGPWTP